MRATGSGTRTFRMEMHSTGTRKAARSSPSFHAPSSIGSVRSRYSSGGTSRKELGARSRLSVRGHARESLDVVSFHRLTNTTTVTGYVVGMNESGPSFTVEARSGDKFECFVGENTWMKVVHNLDGVDTDRMPTPPGFDWSPAAKLKKYVKMGDLLIATGIEYIDGDKMRFDGKTVYILNNGSGGLVFESPSWWTTQIEIMANKWCDLTKENFRTNYRTNLDVSGDIARDTAQEMATLSRLIYGLSSAYLMTGNNRFLRNAADGVKFQREAFRRISSDGLHVFWGFGLRDGKIVWPSQNGDDFGQMPLYEQIYALAGLCQFYRITYDPDVLDDIERTVAMMNHYYLDTKTKHRGYFSHVDAVTLKYDEEALGDNKEQKNWNSIGDHIPAYLVNLMLALEPVPAGSSKEISSFIEKAQWMLKETSDLIMTKFPDPDPEVPYVNERFYTDWKPWQTWRWQQNGAVCGHNLKIAWNMIRSANYFSDKDKEFSENLTQLCCTLGDDLGKLGVDQLRGGLFDVVERKPKNGMFLDFRFWDTKDFWQQEQAILAYYILYGRTNNAEYLKLAREQAAFYNTFFLNHDDNGVYFRTNGDGLPYLVGDYRQAGGHSKSGYHAFELCYLADMYTKMYVTKEKFTLHFKPTDAPRENPNVLNVAPEFVEHGTVKIFSYSVNGEERFPADPFEMTVKLNPGELGADTDVCVTFEPQSFSSYGS